MRFDEFLEFHQIKAVYSALNPGFESVWRAKCREYSIKFHTPLHLVHTMDPEFIVQNLYEDEYNKKHVNNNLDEILDQLRRIKDPTYEPLPQQEIEDLVDAVLNKEIKRNSKKAVSVEPPPTQGGMSFGNLAKQDEAEHGKSFKD